MLLYVVVEMIRQLKKKKIKIKPTRFTCPFFYPHYRIQFSNMWLRKQMVTPLPLPTPYTQTHHSIHRWHELEEEEGEKEAN